jgi:Na+/proline symporter
MRIDWRSVWSILTGPSKAYVLGLLCFSAWNGIALIRHSLLIKRLRSAAQQSVEETSAVLLAQQRNLRELLFLTLILFGFAFFTELFSCIRASYYVRLNPQADVVAPFDALLVLSQVSFGVFAFAQCVRWYMSAKLERVLSKRLFRGGSL